MSRSSPSAFPVRFTQAQRRVIAELFPNLRERLDPNRSNQRTVSFDRRELKTIRDRAEAAVAEAKNGMQRNSLRHVVEIAGVALDRSTGITAIPRGKRLYQFRISLQGIAPSVWRRIQIKDGTLHRLHEHIQTAMGWQNKQRYRFTIGEEVYTDPYLLDDTLDEFGWSDARQVKISEVVPPGGERFRFTYKYDFMDGWLHEILFEGCLRAEVGGRYPVCLEGARACPPEAIGGYHDYLAALAHREHPDHDKVLNGRGSFDPGHFDAEQVTKRMRRGLPRWEHW